MPEEQDSSRLFSTDFQSLSLFRIFFSVYLLADFFAFSWPYYKDFYTDDGVLPLSLLAANRTTSGLPVVLPLLTALETVRLPAVLPILYPAALIGLAIGYRTRWCNAIAFLLNSYLFWRNPFIRSGAEGLAHLLLLWCLFLPMNRYWSVDAALDPQPRDRPYPSLPFLAIRLQVCSMYVFAALFKLSGAPWRGGYAVAWALSDSAFGGTPAGLFLVANAPLVLTAVTYGVMALQLAFPLLVFCPWRNDLTRAFALAGVALMHASFVFALNISGFPFLCLAMLMLLVPDAWIERLHERRRQRLARVSIYFEPECGFCRKVSLLLREFLLTPTASVAPASADPEALRLLRTHTSWVVRGADGRVYLKWHAVTYLLSESLVGRPLAWLMRLRPLELPLERLYDAIGRNRSRLGALSGPLLAFRTDGSPGRPVLALCGLLALLAFAGNVHNLARPVYANPDHLDHLIAGLQVGQRWDLFAPVPVHSQHSYEILAHTSDGSAFDLVLSSPAAPAPERTRRGLEFPNHRWLKYFNRFDNLNDADRMALGDYLCRRAREQDPAGPAIRDVSLTITRTPLQTTRAAGLARTKTHTFGCPSHGSRRTGLSLRPA
jgi:hypothetical protein